MKRSADTSEKALTEAQNAAIYSTDRSIAVVAGAGSGKTTVLIRRLRHIVGEDFSDLDRILAITFTEKAAGELKARLSAAMPARLLHKLQSAWIGTFHSCQARLIRQHAPLVGLDPSFAILDENAGRLAAREAARLTLFSLLEAGDADATFLVDAIDFRTAMAALEDLLDFRWHARRAFGKIPTKDEDEKKILAALANIYKKTEERLLSYFSRAGALDFQALEMTALELLSNEKGVLDSMRRRFKHILVDEFQDTNDVQTELVLKLFEPGVTSLCIVGDPRQSIYRFRGANVDCFSTALGRIRKNGGETIRLAENFRSHPAIVDFVNRSQSELSAGLFGKLSMDGIGEKTEGMIAAREDFASGEKYPAVSILRMEIPPETNAAERRKLEAKAIASHIRALTDSGKFAFGNIVCLFQALTGVSAYESEFRRAGIPCRFYGGRGLLERQEVADLLCALGFASNQADQTSLLGLLRSPLIGLSDDDLVVMAGPDGEGLIKNALADKRCALLHKLTKMSKHLAPSEILRRTMDETGYEVVLCKIDSSGGMAANVARFIELARSIEMQEPMPLAEYVSFIRDLKEHGARLGEPPAAGSASNAVGCMTVHAAKGLEFPVVILPDLFRASHGDRESFVFSRRDGIAFKLKDPFHPFGKRKETERYLELKSVERNEGEAEQKRLLYVAMTRAMDILVLPIHENPKTAGQWHRWVETVAEKEKDTVKFVTAAHEAESMKQDERRATSDERRILVYERRATSDERRFFTVSQLECHDRCPQEYYLKYILGLPDKNILREEKDRLPANVIGSIVHNILERLDPADTGKLDELIRMECVANSVLPDSANMKIIRKEIDAALGISIIQEIARGDREVRFDWRMGETTITGSIDWLKPAANGALEIIDFKTDRVEKSGVEECAKEYELQLAAYALATEAATGKKVGATSLVFLKPGVVHTVKMDDGRKKVGKSRIDSILVSIAGKNFTPPARPPCMRCPYHHNGMCWEDKIKNANT